MAQQPSLFPPNPSDPQQAPETPGREAVPQSGVPVRAISRPVSRLVSWMSRVETIIRIVVRLYLGLLVLALPWLPFWAQNNLFTYDPLLFTLAGSGFVRGAVSGLGLLNVIFAGIEAKDARGLF